MKYAIEVLQRELLNLRADLRVLNVASAKAECWCYPEDEWQGYEAQLNEAILRLQNTAELAATDSQQPQVDN